LLVSLSECLAISNPIRVACAVLTLIPAIAASVPAFSHRIERITIARVVHTGLVAVLITVLHGSVIYAAAPGVTSAVGPGRRTDVASLHTVVAASVPGFEASQELIAISGLGLVLGPTAAEVAVFRFIGELKLISAPSVLISSALTAVISGVVGALRGRTAVLCGGGACGDGQEDEGPTHSDDLA
jgi:hypothetical protein